MKTRTGLAALSFTLVIAAVATAAAPRPPGVVVDVAAGPHDRRETPLVLPLPAALATVPALTLRQLEGERVVEVQVLDVPGMPRSAAWMLEDPLPAGTTRRYRLEAASAASPASRATAAAVTCLHDGKHLRLDVGGRPVLRYNTAMVESPAGIAPHYRKSGQIHPLYSPAGRVVTDDFPPDHAHQHAVFFAWVNTTFEGRHLDFWNQGGNTGAVEHAATLGMSAGPVFGQFQVKLRHDDLTAPGGPKPVLDEVWTVRAYNVSDVFIIDFESRQTASGASPLAINKYHYGGMGLRGNREWLDPTVKASNAPDPRKSGRSDFLTSDGKHRESGNHSRPNWVDLSGRIGDGAAGVALLDHPSNFRFPQPVRLHPNKPYFCFAPMVLGDFEIAPGQPYVSRYRFIVHDGPPEARKIERFWHDYAEPPEVRVVPEP